LKNINTFSFQIKKYLHEKKFTIICCHFLAGANIFAQNIPVDPSVRTGTLPNGMKYYIKEYNAREESGFPIGN
jgi:hypothetical protein